MLIFRFIVLCCDTTRRGLMLKNHISFLILSSLTALYSPSCPWNALFKIWRPPPEYQICSDWSAHTCLSQHCHMCHCGIMWYHKVRELRRDYWRDLLSLFSVGKRRPCWLLKLSRPFTCTTYITNCGRKRSIMGLFKSLLAVEVGQFFFCWFSQIFTFC